jgi:hypothetical protein
VTTNLTTRYPPAPQVGLGAGSERRAPTMNAKARGSRNEHRSLAILEASGHATTRAAAGREGALTMGVPRTPFARRRQVARDERPL